MKKIEITNLYDIGFSYMDIHFAIFMEGLVKTDKTEIFLAAALASHHNRQGHICVNISKIRKQYSEFPVSFPESDLWQKKLEKSDVVGKPGEYKPLILDNKSRLYLYRYWDYQEKLAELIQKRFDFKESDIDCKRLEQGLERLFPANQDQEIDWQRVAAYTALTKKFCVISGGPGTGKTTTVAKILVLLLEQAASKKLRIALAAPTGKAAARLQEAILHAKQNSMLDCSEHIREAIPEEASTIHRLLGSIPNSPYFRHHKKNPLYVDVVVIDEASMVDMALMSKLIQALPLNTRLILLGDKDQLASVEAGAVLGDICGGGDRLGVRGNRLEVIGDRSEVRGQRSEVRGTGAKEKGKKESPITNYQLPLTFDQLPMTPDLSPLTSNPSPITSCIIQLQKSYRFTEDSGIRRISRAVNTGNADAELIHLKEGKYKDIFWKDLPHPDALGTSIRDAIINGFKDYLNSVKSLCEFQISNFKFQLTEIFKKFDQFRILCALRQGHYGVEMVNRLAEQIFRKEKLIASDKIWYPGRPVMITSNDYNLHLFNGDIGITLPDPEANNEIRVFFPASNGSSDMCNPFRKFNPHRLPYHETVYAMTVHKSQGSEFEKVLLLLPNKDYPLLTRELIYTGITRAIKNVEIWGNEAIFCAAVSRRIERTSGLEDALWEY